MSGEEPLARGCPPRWACSWGQDEVGVFAGFVVDAVEYRMRWIPAGEFWMGSPATEEGRYGDEGPRHRVRISKGFWLGETPVTQGLWEAVMGSNPSWFKGEAERPVVQVSWEDVQGFIAALEKLAQGLGVRLPSEEEWEYACRAGTEGPTYAGAGEAALEAIAWWNGNSGGMTHPVRMKKPNAWGLHDMLGNVWEWCSDAWYAYSGASSGAGSGAGSVLVNRVHPGSPGDRRVGRGGSWFSRAGVVRAAFRYLWSPGVRLDGLGFRLARGQEESSNQ